uniref:Uncharacterized protein n=1 Tax=Chlamydomonas chlamydogama TaxID=225041 RepID=A0A7S2QUB0_9CHLO
MGVVASRARQQVGSAVQQRVFQRRFPDPLTADEQSLLSKLAERDQERLKELPSYEELNAKDGSLDQLLNKLGGSIKGQRVNISGESTEVIPASKTESIHAPSSSGRESGDQQFVWTKQTTFKGIAASASRKQRLEDEEAGRLPSYILRDILEAKNAAESQGKDLDVASLTQG